MSPIPGPLPHGRSAARFRGKSRDSIIFVRQQTWDLFHTSVEQQLPPHWSERSAYALAGWLALQDLTFGALIGGLPNLCNSFVYPRNLLWKTLPVVRRHEFDHGEGGVETYRVNPDGRRVPHQHSGWRHHRAMLLEARAILYDAPDLDERMFWQTFAPVFQDIMDSDVPLLWFDGKEVRIVPIDYLEEVLSRGLLSDRLQSNLHANLAIFMSRAASHLAIQENWTVSRLGRLVGTFPGSSVTSVLGLQILYDLADVPGVAEKIDCRSSPAPVGRIVAAAGRWIEHENGRPVFVWKGNGGHAPLRLDPWSQRTGAVGIDAPAQCLGQLTANGYIGVGEDGHLRLTKVARQLLEAIGDGVRDLDLPLRWIGKGMEEGRAVDRWLNATLRKVKRRVSPLAASPFAGRNVGDAPFHRGHGLFVYAAVVEFPVDIRPILSDIEDLKKLEESLPFHERTFGVVRTPHRVVKDWGTALWVGVPLGVLHPYRHTQIVESSLAAFDEEIEKAKASLPLSLRRHLSNEPNRLLIIGWTDAVERPAEGWWRAETKPVPSTLRYPKLPPFEQRD